VSFPGPVSGTLRDANRQAGDGFDGISGVGDITQTDNGKGKMPLVMRIAKQVCVLGVDRASMT
jgi:hypothetical protein